MLRSTDRDHPEIEGNSVAELNMSTPVSFRAWPRRLREGKQHIRPTNILKVLAGGVRRQRRGVGSRAGLRRFQQPATRDSGAGLLDLCSDGPEFRPPRKATGNVDLESTIHGGA